MKKLYTIGHSNHELDYFLELLQSHHINCIIDVRSIAASAYNPQYNKAPLSKKLKQEGIVYMHFEKEFGARHTDPELLDENGKVDFEKVRQTDGFQRGVKRLKQGIERGFQIALMCSEGAPLDCHRFSMITVHLAKMGFDIHHILKDKSLISNTEMEEKLLQKYAKKLPQPSLFEPHIGKKEQLEFAYKLINKDIAFQIDVTKND